MCAGRGRERLASLRLWFVNVSLPSCLRHGPDRALTSTGSSFRSDLDFCPECGSVLPLPGAQDTVACARCGFPVSVRGEGCRQGPRGSEARACGRPDREGARAASGARVGPEEGSPGKGAGLLRSRESVRSALPLPITNSLHCLCRLRRKSCEDLSCVPQSGDSHACVGGGRT